MQSYLHDRNMVYFQFFFFFRTFFINSKLFELSYYFLFRFASFFLIVSFNSFIYDAEVLAVFLRLLKTREALHVNLLCIIVRRQATRNVGWFLWSTWYYVYFSLIDPTRRTFKVDIADRTIGLSTHAGVHVLTDTSTSASIRLTRTCLLADIATVVYKKIQFDSQLYLKLWTMQDGSQILFY